MVRVAINGFGRVGRAFFRAWYQQRLAKYAGIDIVAINDCADAENLAYLLQHDSVYGRFPVECLYDAEAQQLSMVSHSLPLTRMTSIPGGYWADLKVDWVIEATGCCGKRPDHVSSHWRGGAPRVLVTGPVEEADIMLVPGVNSDCYQGQRYVSAASCTAHGLASVCHPLISDGVGGAIEAVMMTELHACTLDQPVLDSTHENHVRGRAAAFNMVPTLTTGDRVIGYILPSLEGRVQGCSVRVPVPNGVCLNLTLVFEQAVTKDRLIKLYKETAAQLGAVLAVTERPWVSSDVTQCAMSAVLDLNHFRVNGRTLQLMAWYDNEWGYVSRLLDFLATQCRQ